MIPPVASKNNDKPALKAYIYDIKINKWSEGSLGLVNIPTFCQNLNHLKIYI